MNLYVLGSLFTVSWLICSLGQPSASFYFSVAASLFGYALFWRGLSEIACWKKQGCIAFLWFFLLSSFQLSWMLSFTYQGVYIAFLHQFLSAAVALQFAALCFALIRSTSKRQVVYSAALWTLFEWSRLYWLCGSTWNPAGLSLTASKYTISLATVGGIYFLSFWVIMTNGLFFFAYKKKQAHAVYAAVFCAFLPYAVGFIHQARHSQSIASSPKLSAALIQTAIKPEEKEPILKKGAFIDPLLQWERIWRFLQKAPKDVDIIVLPEVALPFGAFGAIYYEEAVKDAWQVYFGKEALRHMPPLTYPYATQDIHGYWYVSNGYIAKALANYFQAELILGLEERMLDATARNSAFYFAPFQAFPRSYAKCVLVPGAEYIPYSWCEGIARKHGAKGAYVHGKIPGVVAGAHPLGLSICYEETYGDLIRKTRKRGAQLLVNLSNDGWFPGTALPRQHFDLARVRSVENGAPLVRATNTGITAAVDSLGQVVAAFTPAFAENPQAAGALFVDVPVYTYGTWYTQWGDGLIVSISLGLIFLCMLEKWRKEQKASQGKALAQKIPVR